MDRIKAVENIYGKVSRGIHLRIQALLGNIPDEPQIQQFNDIQFQTPPQQPAVEPLYPALSKPSPYVYQPHQPQQPPKQPPPILSLGLAALHLLAPSISTHLWE